MAPNPFMKNDPAKLAAQRARQQARPNNRGGGGGGGGGMGGGGGGMGGPGKGGPGKGGPNNRKKTTDVVGDDTTTTFAGADPQAFFRGLLTNAGFDPTATNGMGDFLNTNLASNFQAGWNTYQTNPANVNKTLWDYVRDNNMGVPESFLQAQQAEGAYTANPADWQEFQQQILGQINRYSPQQLGTYDPGKQAGSVRWNLFG